MVRPFQYLLLLCSWGIAQPVWAQRCADMAQTPMEQVFCQVQAADASALQVTLGEFRRNPEATQRLLLRRPAQRLGLTLPAADTPSPASSVESKPQVAAPASATANALAEPPAAPGAPIVAAPGLAGCTLQTQVLVCDTRRFELLGNQPNSALATDALEHTELLLPPLAGENGSEGEGVHRYLSRAYQQYIRQMAAIGLAGATMSYTKFYHTFEQSQIQGTDFSQRMAQMFEFLKQDKRNLQVQAHYTQQRPKSVEQCVSLDERWVVCDDVHNNWVYRRTQ